MKHLGKILIAAGALALSAMSHAVPVTNWAVTTTGVWSSFAPGGVTLSNAGHTLSWGTSTGSGQSSLVITNPVPAVQNVLTLFTGDPLDAAHIANSVTLTHNNNPITGTSLTDATLRVSVSLQPTNPAAGGFPLPNIDYLIKFVETPNQAPCAAPSPANNPCNDIFVQVAGLLNESFLYDGQTYFVNAFPTNGGVLSVLPTSACTAAGVGAGCIGFTTQEGQSTQLPFGLTISTERLQVPEPGSLALIGLALAGAGLISRRRRNT
ncbi:MAG: PEP-CTERM sorting domain-containing protein [Proteobacteria bacterium]|nr:PEP-CTERM sorting domain-containing protein [Pseudomonadota bacterium]MBS0494953.1 PEP-CTERM sorting domain-containing protein [Pseudomonadota bacterium]